MRKKHIAIIIAVALAIALAIALLPTAQTENIEAHTNGKEVNISGDLLTTISYEPITADITYYDGNGAKIGEEQGIWSGNIKGNELTKFDIVTYNPSRFTPISAKLTFKDKDKVVKEEKVYLW